MAVIHRLKCQVWYDSTLPRDAMNINPVFKHNGAIVDMDAFCQTMADYIDAQTGGHPQIVVQSYDVEGTKPVYPDGRGTKNTGASPASSVPREIALCLSYYAGQNVKRKRGRLYIPLQWIATKTTNVRPQTAQMDLVKEWGNGFSAMGGADVDWGVYSTVDHTFRKATNTYVDDEWDIVRSRGLKPIARSAASVSG